MGGAQTGADLLYDERVPHGGEQQDEGQDGDPQLLVRLRSQVRVIAEECFHCQVHLITNYQLYCTLWFVFITERQSRLYNCTI